MRDRARASRTDARRAAVAQLRGEIEAAEQRAGDLGALVIAVRDQASATQRALLASRRALATERAAHRDTERALADAREHAAIVGARRANGDGEAGDGYEHDGPAPGGVEAIDVEQLLDGARAARADAEARASRAERRLAALAQATPEPTRTRPLRSTELDELRSAGAGGESTGPNGAEPSGPAVLASALKALAAARARGDREGTSRALAELAAAAVRWRDRL